MTVMMTSEQCLCKMYAIESTIGCTFQFLYKGVKYLNKI